MASTHASARVSKILPVFLQHILDILEDADPTVARWSRLGDSFLVTNAKRFSEEHLAHHFKSAQFSSFVRQLNFYGFHKISGDNKRTWEFKHECFIRGRLDLIRTIKRRTSADYHTAGKGEVAELRQRVGVLEGELKHAEDHFAALAQFIARVHGAEAVSRMSVPAHVAEALEAAGMKANVSASGQWPARQRPALTVAVPETVSERAAPSQPRRAATGGGDSPFSEDDLAVLEDSDVEVELEDSKASGRRNVPGAQPVKRRRVEQRAPASASATVEPLNDEDLELLAEMEATDKGVSIEVPESMEDISTAFSSSLDFTGAGAVAGPASPEEAWAWAEKSEPISKVSPRVTGFAPDNYPKGNPAGGPPTPTGSQISHASDAMSTDHHDGASGPVSPAVGISTAALFAELAARVVNSFDAPPAQAR